MWKVVLCRESDRRGDMIGEVMNHVALKRRNVVKGFYNPARAAGKALRAPTANLFVSRRSNWSFLAPSNAPIGFSCFPTLSSPLLLWLSRLSSDCCSVSRASLLIAAHLLSFPSSLGFVRPEFVFGLCCIFSMSGDPCLAVGELLAFSPFYYDSLLICPAYPADIALVRPCAQQHLRLLP